MPGPLAPPLPAPAESRRAGGAVLSALWRGVGGVAALAARPVLLWSRLRGDRDGARDLAERLALAEGLVGLPGGGLWLHGASVGEIRALVPLVRALRTAAPAVPIVVTSTTTAGRARAAEELDPGARLAPLDAAGPVGRFLRHVQPRLHVVVETEIWPTRLAALRRAGIPAAMVSARLSPERVPSYRRLGALYGPTLAGLSLIAPASEGDRARLLAVGADPARLAPEGNLKWDAAPRPATEDERSTLAATLGLDPAVPWIVLGSVHPGEGWPLFEATEALLGGRTGWLIAPRHPERYAQELQRFEGLAGGAWRASAGPAPAGTRRIVLDRIGLLPRVYPLAHAAVLGGSFVPVGGHSPLEAAAGSCPLVAGPHVGHQLDLVEPLAASGGLVQVRDVADAARQLAGWIGDPDRARRDGQAARGVLESRRGVSAALAARLLDLAR